MVGWFIIGIIVYNVIKSLGGKDVESSVTKTNTRARPEDGSREDYIRGYLNEDKEYDRM